MKDLKKEFTPVIGIGSSEKMNSSENPLSFNERRKMVKKCFPGIDVFPVPDRNDDDSWVEQIVEKIRFSTVITGNEWTERCFRKKGFETRKPNMYNRELYKATRIRKMAATRDDSWKDLVPQCSKKLLERFNFEKRMEQIMG